jgi:DNA-damage-inducible protein J
MPTIQFRTDDQTKTASTTLFSKLGITMSEAINLFLRQSIMHGGIPFTLNVPQGHEPGNEVLDDEAVAAPESRKKASPGH